MRLFIVGCCVSVFSRISLNLNRTKRSGFFTFYRQLSLCLLLMTGLSNSSTETEIKDLKLQLQTQGELLNATRTLLAQALKAVSYICRSTIFLTFSERLFTH